ncbi:MAG: hypothetical protein GTO14_06495 [Anaerolineales bacterium]|nr:hypothetical protein [Anaerolineales bacterium]
MNRAPRVITVVVFGAAQQFAGADSSTTRLPFVKLRVGAEFILTAWPGGQPACPG